ncbi:hypothetical protein C0J52_08828 [Blattella germanica]|nr:hypothetical protein C0J52_08828 [Blattella germanica]
MFRLLQIRNDAPGSVMDVFNIEEASERPKPSFTKLSIAEKPGDNDVFDQLPDDDSDPFADPFTTAAAALLGNSSPAATTTLPAYYDDAIVGRISCANGTSYSSFLDCYNESYVGGLNNGSRNGSAMGGIGGEEPLGDVILMGVTSVILGLMILITVIGKQAL